MHRPWINYFVFFGCKLCSIYRNPSVGHECDNNSINSIE